MKFSLLSSKTFFSLTMVLSIVFIVWGDVILPKPLSLYSRNTRQKLEHTLIGLFPNIDAEATRPSRKREQKIQEFEREADPSPNQN
uniref:Uncharacterized protein n=1 Tax=Gloeothece verrucosa (strain PCC 7822) TaxID=497965 RepID=E0UII8_GLOV7|nr:hypothetical protein Cyan7822_0131 [Gloeothece verrucosa PCC 7822]